MSAWPSLVWWVLAAAGFILLLLWLVRQVRAILSPARGVDISLVAVVKNRGDVVEGAIRELVARYGWWRPDGPGYEIVVVDDGSMDDTWAILTTLARRNSGFLRVANTLDNAAGLVTSPLDLGLSLARGRSAMIVDLDSVLPKQKEMSQRRRTKTGTGAPGFERECLG